MNDYDQPNERKPDAEVGETGDATEPPRKKSGRDSGSFFRKLFAQGQERDLTPLELRTRLLDAVVRTVEPYRGQEPLPFNRLGLYVLAPIQQDRARYEAALDDADPPFDVAARQRLKEAGFALPKTFPVEHAVYEESPEPLRPAFEKYGAVYVEPSKKTATRYARLEIQRGRAEQAVYALDGTARVNIGRMPQVADERTRVFRRNHVVFLDPADADLDADTASINQTVSREHAHVTFDAEQGRYLWHNEQGSTSINRAAYQRPMPVGKQPLPLEDGDELYLGQACLVFHLGREEE